MRVQIDHQDFRKVLSRYDSPETLFYIDPPYTPGERRSGTYQCELSESDHADLVEQLLALRGRAILSGYHNEIYRPLERAGWRRRDFDVCSTAAKAVGGKFQRRTESVWCSFPPPSKRRRRPKAKPAAPIHAVYSARIST